MATQEIPREQWSNFFDAFSRQHEGWLATLEVFKSNLGAQSEASELPLEGVSISSPDAISVSFGEDVTHTIDQPEHVWVETTIEGVNAALEIESKDQTKTLLRFRSPMPPEMVDGVVFS
jgi:Family of unknown function (DUF5335)